LEWGSGRDPTASARAEREDVDIINLRVMGEKEKN